MKEVKNIISLIAGRLKELAKENAVATTPISDGERHVLPLCELAISFGGGGGLGENMEEEQEKKPSKGIGGGAGGSARAVPVAVVVSDKNGVSLKTF